MTIIQSIILGIVQGITEFFPISSSGHLIAIRFLFDFKDALTSKEWLVFDIALHFGTLMAVGIFFFKDFILMFKEGFKFRKEDKQIKFRELTAYGKMFWYIIAACIPGAVIAIIFEDHIDSVIRDNPLIIAITLTVMGIILYIVDKFSKSEKELEKITLKDAMLIGIGQAFAIIPGFSRSGTTMTVARALKIKKEDSAKFSFLLGAPVILGAAILSLKELTTNMLNIQFFIGIIVSFLVGLVAIKTLLYIVKKTGFKIFAIYRVLLALVIMLKYFNIF